MIGIVAIGRNEGERLRVCLSTALRAGGQVVYVDSGSTDESVQMARALGANVVELDLSIPFTAARGRNAGVDRLLEIAPDLQFVQFVDGDCEIVDGWMGRATAELAAKPKAAVVCGRRRERHPRASIYNTLCDIEWNTPVGQANACGGDAMMRLSAFRAVGGFNPSIIAGEEPEMCVRLRQAEWEIWRIDAEMTLHDANLMRFGQWWKRSLRAGHAYAEGYALHGKSQQRHNAKQVRSTAFWALILPLVILVGGGIMALTTPRWWVAPLITALLYPLLLVKIFTYRIRGGLSWNDALLYAIFVVLGKFAEALGMLKYWLSRASGRRSTVIEYKGPAIAATKMRADEPRIA